MPEGNAEEIESIWTQVYLHANNKEKTKSESKRANSAPSIQKFHKDQQGTHMERMLSILKLNLHYLTYQWEKE